MRKLIYTVFPVNFSRYTEVLGGGDRVLLGKPPDQKCMGVYDDYNSDLANLFYYAKNWTVTFLQELGFPSLNSRDEFTVTRDFIGKRVFDTSLLKEEL